MANQIQNKQVGRYQPYPEYKDSGVEWLGKIPSHWSVTKFKFFYHSAMGETILKEDLVLEGNIPVYSATEEDIIFGYVNYSKIMLESDDLVIPARGNSIGNVKKIKGIATATQTTIYAKKYRNIDSQFIYYFLKGLKKYLFYFTQTAIPQITVEEVANKNIVNIPLQEQTQIAQFLDYETAKIDLLIEKQQKLIELLKEKRQAVISHAVTKGLDPNVEMKDSGVEWLGEVPAHWEIRKLKYLVSLINIKVSNSYLNYVGLENIESKTGRFLATEKIIPEGVSNIFKEGNILFGKLRPYLAKVWLANDSGICSSEFLVLDCHSINNSYLQYLLLTDEVIDEVNSSTYGSQAGTLLVKY